MEENSKNMKITYTKNLNNFNFNTTLSTPIDANANIKTILNIDSYLFDQKVECGNGKAIISGKVGVKVLYIDSDNMTNTITDSVSFSENYNESSITSETYLNISTCHISNNLLSTEGTLKINFEITISPVAYLNLGISSLNSSNDNLITKKSEIKTNSISNVVSTKFEHTINLETKYNVSKILANDSYLCIEKVAAENGFAVVEGKISTCFVFETQENDEVAIKVIKETFNFKHDVETNGLEKDNILDLSFELDKSKTSTSIENEDNTNIIITNHTIKVCGVVLKNISIGIIDDLFSTESEVEVSKTQRECSKGATTYNISEVISNEISLSNEETAIDEIVANLSNVAEITNTYIKDNHIFVEGVLSSSLAYVDENKEYKQKQLELPFIINTKIPAEELGCVHHNINIVDSRVKVKRGTIIELEHTLFITLTLFEKANHEMVDNFTLGKPLNLGEYDYQIFIAKQGETMWDLCKRIKISPENISQYNKDLPLIMNGGEKIIIKR